MKAPMIQVHDHLPILMKTFSSIKPPSAERRRTLLRAAALACLGVGATPALSTVARANATSAASETNETSEITKSNANQKWRIADGWYAHNAIMVMLGATDRIVSTVARPASFPWMYRVAPKLHQAQAVAGNHFNAENLLALHTDLVFVSKGQADAATFRRLGLDTLEVGFDTFSSLLDCVDESAKAIGSPLALQRAASYRRYLEGNLIKVKHGADAGRSTTSGSLALAAPEPTPTKTATPPRVLHVVRVEPLRVDGEATLINEWIKAAGGVNAARDLTGNLREVSMEQVLAYDPDIVILAADAGDPKASTQAALWASLRAVQQARIYRNPAGVFPWDRYGPEAALQVLWAAQVIQHGGVDSQAQTALKRETARFYRDFFDYSLSDTEATKIMAGLPPI